MLLNHFLSNINIVILNGLNGLSQLFWLAPNTFCGHWSMWLLHFHGMQEHFERVLYTFRCWHIIVIRCSFSSEEETITFVYCFHLLLFSDITHLLNNRKTTSVLSQRYPCCVGNRHTYAKKSLLPLSIFLCPAIRTVFPHAVRTLQDKKNKVKHFQIFLYLFYKMYASLACVILKPGILLHHF